MMGEGGCAGNGHAGAAEIVHDRAAAISKPTASQVRPVANPRDISVLHRIEVDVIDVTFEVLVVADRVLPKPS